MNIEHLRYVIEVDRAGSISQAAENLYMGQPNLSKAIKELEQTLNITIFKRTSKGAVLTPKGREFLRYAQGILQQYEEMEALGKEDEAGVQTLRISVPRASYVVDAFTTFLSGLDMDRPIEIDLAETNALRAIRNVTSGHSSFGIIRCKTEYQSYFTSLLMENGLEWKLLLRSKYMVLISSSNLLADAPEIDENLLQPFIEIIHGDTAMPYVPASITETERGRTLGDKKVHVYERGSQFDILSRVKGAYMWVSPMPKDLLERNNLIQKSCKHAPEFSDFLIYPKNLTLKPDEEKFMELLQNSVKNITGEL